MNEANRNKARLVVSLMIGALTMAGSAWVVRAIRGRSEGSSSRTTPAPVVVKADSRLAPSSSRGKLLYQVHCVRCHGAEGHGDGPDSANAQPAPRDFAAPGWRFDSSPGSIRRVIVEGIPATSMYPLGGYLSPRELDAVVEHVRTLARSREARISAPGLGPEHSASLRSAGFEPAPSPALAPSFAVEDLAGQPRTFAWGPSSKATLLVFWGTSCAPCLEELPELQRIAREFGPLGLEVVPVCVDETDRVRVSRAMLGRFDHSPGFVSVDGLARLRFDIQTLPVAALIDRRGRLIGIARGGIDWNAEASRRLIAGCLAEGD